MPSVDSAYQEAGREYFRRYYELGVWKRQHYRGVRVLKLPSDLWNYQEIFTDYGIEWVVETGTAHGGSALFFADLLAMGGGAGRVITIDISQAVVQFTGHTRIDFVLANSASEETAARVAEMLPANRGPLFMILDSDHRKGHVLRELELFVPLMRRGDYLVVEDGCVNGHPVRPEFGPGPLEAIEEFLQQRPGLFVADRERELKFGCTAAPSGYLIRA